MNIAFYAPLKPPDHPAPSGDRRVARLLMLALKKSGHRVDLASRFRSRDGAGDPDLQARLRRRGTGIAARLREKYLAAPAAARPELWFTYHLYYKAPDWIGPPVARALGIPYVVAEASHAPKRAGGPWRMSHEVVADALGAADLVIGLNPGDSACVRPMLAPGAELAELAPFLDQAPYRKAQAARARHRRDLVAAFGLDPERPVLLAVGMMRPGDKQASYRVLAEALERIAELPWQLLVVGDGEAGKEIGNRLQAAAPGRCHFAGTVDLRRLPAVYAGSDLLVWPAINEAYGMAILEAQAAGLPVVAGASPGVASIVAGGETGLLPRAGDAKAFAEAIAELLADTDRAGRMGAAGLAKVSREHSLQIASKNLDNLLLNIRKKGSP